MPYEPPLRARIASKDGMTNAQRCSYHVIKHLVESAGGTVEIEEDGWDTGGTVAFIKVTANSPWSGPHGFYRVLIESGGCVARIFDGGREALHGERKTAS